MNTERWRQIENLFDQALERPVAERQEFLDQVCQGDEELRREVESLLECDAPNDSLIDVPTVLDADTRDSESDITGQRVGPYRIIRLIGRGGMGAVYLGVRDDDQYRKQVAIKLLKRGMDSDFMLSRFRQERQILANLEHPFIARLIDGGATESGLPYLVMEYVEGIPITTYCTTKGLTVAERLRLFRLVCEAVQYAHQNLVVHRDIKPSNILTTKEGIPKLLDFGIAKVVNPEMSTDMTLTRREFRMLTPDYASPEQVKGEAISTAADIYSLGAVLYELLCGQRAHQFRSESITEMERVICEEDPKKPSLAADKPLQRQLAGDLDNIVLTAMRKEPQRRYSSAAEFSEDLRRHLESLPIMARDDEWTYKAGKFIRRNRLTAGAALLLAVSLIGGIVATTIQARRAEQRFQMVRGLARSMLFDLYNEMEKLPGSIALRAATIRTVVNYLDALAESGSQDPELELEIATAYERVAALEGHPFASNLGRGTEALRNYRKALTFFERLAKRSGYRKQAMRGMLDMHMRIAGMEALQGNPEVSVSHSRKATEIATAAFARGTSEIPPNTQINMYFRLADLAYERGSAEELTYYRKALELAQTWAADGGGDTAASRVVESYRNVGSAQARTGDLPGALESYRSSQKAAEELARRSDVKPDHHSAIINIHTAIGDVLAAPDDPNFGDHAGAVARYRQALAIAERLAAADPKNVNGKRLAAGCYWRLGMILAEAQPAQAVEYARKALQISEELGAGDPRNVEYRYHASRAFLWMGKALDNLGQHREAVDSLTRAVELQNMIAATAPQRIWNLRVLSRTHAYLGAAQLNSGDSGGALVSLRQGLEVADRMLHRAPSSLSHQLDRADVLEAMGRYYAALARSPKVADLQRTELRRQARSCFEGSGAIWQDWIKRNLALPYAVRRKNEANQPSEARGFSPGYHPGQSGYNPEESRAAALPGSSSDSSVSPSTRDSSPGLCSVVL